MGQHDLALVLLLAGIAFACYMFVKQLGGALAIIGHSITPLAREDRKLLQHHSTYYRTLAAAEKKEFEKRVKEVLFEKEWIGRGLEVTQEMRVRVAAALVQLTFGLERLLLLHFQRIELFPQEYRDRSTGKLHQGGVRPASGTITLSWKHFDIGFADPHDARNLALHELAHALWVENGMNNGEVGFLDRDLLRQWKHLATQEMERIRNGQGHLFRSYASTDQAEFFAVAVEYFFERPRAFAHALPELYGLMRLLLGQDPAMQRPPESTAY